MNMRASIGAGNSGTIFFKKHINMNQTLLSFRIFDKLTKKYVLPDGNVYVGLDGQVYTLEGLGEKGRFELAHSLPFFDVNGKQLFTDDGVVVISGRKTAYARPGLSENGCWGLIVGNGDEIIPLESKTFEIFPNAAEVAAGNLGTEILRAWEKKADDLPEPEGQNAQSPFAHMASRSRDFVFANLAVELKIYSESPMSDDQWDEAFKSVMDCDVIFKCSKDPSPEDVEFFMETYKKLDEEVAVKLTHTIEVVDLEGNGSSQAPADWRMLPEIAAAKPTQTNCEKSLQLVDGTENVVYWSIGRGGNWSRASSYFLVKSVLIKDSIPSSDESANT